MINLLSMLFLSLLLQICLVLCKLIYNPHLRCTAAYMDFDNPSTTNVVPTPPLHGSFRRLTQGRHWSVPLNLVCAAG